MTSKDKLKLQFVLNNQYLSYTEYKVQKKKNKNKLL